MVVYVPLPENSQLHPCPRTSMDTLNNESGTISPWIRTWELYWTAQSSDLPQMAVCLTPPKNSHLHPCPCALMDTSYHESGAINSWIRTWQLYWYHINGLDSSVIGVGPSGRPSTAPKEFAIALLPLRFQGHNIPPVGDHQPVDKNMAVLCIVSKS